MIFGCQLCLAYSLFYLLILNVLIHQTCSISISKRICRVCKQSYVINEISTQSKTINEKPCIYHSGRWIGAELSKHYGTRSGGELKGLSLFWDCCDSENPLDPGCRRGVHKSYDDEDPSNMFMNRR